VKDEENIVYLFDKETAHKGKCTDSWLVPKITSGFPAL
jgi:hypothetical protein